VEREKRDLLAKKVYRIVGGAEGTIKGGELVIKEEEKRFLGTEGIRKTIFGWKFR